LTVPNIFSDWRDATALAYSTAGYAVTVDPATVNPPCVVVGPVEVVESAGHGAFDIQASVWLVHPAPAGTVALDYLEANLPALLSLAPEFTQVELGTYSHPVGELPAYRIKVETTIKE
jgi:hypothetical protein